MSKLSELIARLCPDGVEYKRLGDIATDIYRGAGITRDQVTETGNPCVRYGEIYTTYGVWFENCVSHTQESKISNRKYFEHGDILFAITGESVDEIAKSTAYIGNDRCLAGGDIVVLKHNQNPKYLAYALSTAEAQVQKSKGKTKSKVVHSSVPAIKGIKIPVPPLEVQAEIVRILDDFAELTTELTEKLNAELIARKKQYEYYRDLLLTFDDAECPRGGDTHSCSAKLAVRWAKLGDICNISRGIVISKQFIKNNIGEYPVYSSQTENDGMLGKISTYAYEGEYVTWTTDGANAGTVFYRNGKFNITNVCGLLEPKDESVSVKFLYYILSIGAPKYVSKGMGNPKLMSNVVAKISIPVPPLSEQRRIVAILDRFDALCHDITAGLPAEIAARKKQYAYYRDKLLTFKEKTA